MLFKAVRLGAAALVSLSMLALASPAYAGPHVPPPVTQKSVGSTPGRIDPPSSLSNGNSYTWNLSQARWDSAKRGAKALDPAHTNSSGQIDYSWVKDKFSGHSTQLYEFTAGFWYRRKDWGQFTHISSSDKSKVISWSKSHGGPNPQRVVEGAVKGDKIAAALAASVQPGAMLRKAPKPCTGRTVYAYDSSESLWWLYTNSCDTANTLDAMDTGVEIIGILGAVFGVITDGLAAIPAAVWGGELWIVSKYIENRKNASTLDAVIYRFALSPVSKSGRFYAPMKVYPQ